MLTQKTNIHNSVLPEVGKIGKLIMKRNRWNEPEYYQGIKSNWMCIAYDVCNSADYRFSWGIHLAYFQSLKYPKLIVRVSGFYLEELKMEAKIIDNNQPEFIISKVAREILNQLGGNKFIAMTGAKNWYVTGNSISFKIGRNSKGISWVLITLNEMDTYDINFNSAKGTPRSRVKGIYADQLQETFTQHTGLDTNL